MALRDQISVFKPSESYLAKLQHYFDGGFNGAGFCSILSFIKSRITSAISKCSIIYLFTILLLCLSALISLHYHIPIANFTRDPLAIADAPPLLGFISNIGAILWSFSVAFCLLCVSILLQKETSSIKIGFIGTGGLISLLLLVDDLFMIHERIFPKYLGIPEIVLYTLYGSLLLFYLAQYRRTIIDTEFVILFFALLFFGLSILIDRLPESRLPMHHLFEDGTKFIGIVSWVCYQFSVCSRELGSTHLGKDRGHGRHPR